MAGLVTRSRHLHHLFYTPANFARTITLTALDQLDISRRNQVIIFLNSLELIQARDDREPIISLFNASIQGLSGAGFNFSGADLGMTTLEDADVAGSSFMAANLLGADLTGSSFYYCDFRSARLQVVSLKGVNMYECTFDENTVLPNGKTWNDQVEMGKMFGVISKPPITVREERQALRDAGIKSN